MTSLRRWVASRLASVEISESRGVRYLHLGGDAIQSALRLSNPDALELHYTRAVMGYLLLVPEPAHFLVIGLGGGSIPRFVRHARPRTRVTAVEINPRVLAAARAWFGLPADDPGLDVVIADGAQYVPAHPGSCDALLLDAFDDGRSVRALSSERFYAACRQALTARGVFIQNFMADDPERELCTRRIEQVFGGQVAALPAANGVNVIIFGLADRGLRLGLPALERRAQRLELLLGLPFEAMLKSLVRHNSWTLAEGFRRKPL
jgi:spermidine synthase